MNPEPVHPRSALWELLEEVDICLRRSLEEVTKPPCPPLLAQALRYAVFPGGARIRPQLCCGVFSACGGSHSGLAVAAAASAELFHCASLVQDDLPCFDDALMRRGRPALHRVFGEAQAVLAGDALIILASDLVLATETDSIKLRTAIQRRLLKAVGAQSGLVAGQAWESESQIDLGHYHSCKTISLFETAAYCGARAGNGDEQLWSRLGRHFGAAYQIADDILDVAGAAHSMGKPVGQDRRALRPNFAQAKGLDHALDELHRLLTELEAMVPECAGRDFFLQWLREVCSRILERLGAGESRDLLGALGNKITPQQWEPRTVYAC